ncbi:threonine synthase [Sporanaerobium hydrogeniformans]|uniref:Threonine synthase n=1 Tax=Sporanaerobium hydrogeniformans TaxID=3072179 RepID=A0AC61DGG9_9FIRM|nr:threonine synthase [Sporanaerobium hydrogeniformans]PHV71950.1 threonine synthase [Sporanaerobium hydrogeniformans]
MFYTSTRSFIDNMTATKAILQGISEEGGLFVPTRLPQIDFSLEELLNWDYKELAYRVIRLFFDDMKEEDLKYCIENAYDSKFDTDKIAPLACAKSANFLELFHGPTIAFKDMALSILPYFMLTSKKYNKEEKDIVILTATSGDTGKAALEGFANVAGTKIIVFFPQDGVSDVQKRQMLTQEGDNTLVVGVKGNFDDCQTGVKEIFGDNDFATELNKKNYAFSSANSINIGRLVPQVAYYFSAYAQLVKAGKLECGKPMNVTVPTGNFGNILAAYYAKNMGLPINKFLCASNTNKVLFDFLQTGTYDRNREFFLTASPSMDILISSNLERLLYHISGENTELIKEMMADLKEKGLYTITDGMKEKLSDFYGGYADDEITKATIKKVYDEEGYLMDTHTAVAYATYDKYVKETGDQTPNVIVSTASPYKFTGSVMTAIDAQYEGKDDFTLLEEMHHLIKGDMPKAMDQIATRPIKHDTICEVSEMKHIVSQFLV